MTTKTYRQGRILKRLFRVRFPSKFYDRNLGWLLGNRICRLSHVGRKSGKQYRTVLEVADKLPDTGELVVVSGMGKSDWYRNIHANGIAEFETGRRKFTAQFRDLSIDEAAGLLVRHEQNYPRIMTPFIRHMLSKLGGWKYDGSLHARRKLAEQLPMVAFAPADTPDSPETSTQHGETNPAGQSRQR